MANVAIGTSVNTIGSNSFRACTNLTSIVVPEGVANIGNRAFSYCFGLSNIYFRGNAPVAGNDVFFLSTNLTVYYLPGALGWPAVPGLWPEGADGRPTAYWLPKVMAQDIGVQDDQFGFNVDWTEGQTVVVDACTNLADPVWVPLETNTMAGDAFHFSDSLWTNYTGRFYRIRNLP